MVHNSHMSSMYRRRRIVTIIISMITAGVIIVLSNMTQPVAEIGNNVPLQQLGETTRAKDALLVLPVKGRAPKTDYSRSQFGNGWTDIAGCDTRNIILNRDMSDVITNDSCDVMSGVLLDPYTGKKIAFTRGSQTSADVQIDHVVALSNAWQTGAQQLTMERRVALANDPLELLAVDGPANQEKSDGDAATWLPAYKPFRCQYVARQIAVKQKYDLWVTIAEKNAMISILEVCPDQTLPSDERKQ
jgi:Protein of unknown function (DUF1524)